MPSTAFDTRIHLLKNQAVRDLAWCCFSVPIMAEIPGSCTRILTMDDEILWPWLQGLDRDPHRLFDHLDHLKSTRLGIYYEALWHFYFAHRPEWKLLAHNLQVERGGNTLGAFDFLCAQGDEYWHIETAVKFYLCATDHPLDAYEWSRWIGPGQHDRLDLKLSHLRDHQLSLHTQPEAINRLCNEFPKAKEWRSGLCLQGYLFFHAKNPCKPAFGHLRHEGGEWWYWREFLDELNQSIVERWSIMDRAIWLSPAHVKNNEEALTSEELYRVLTAIAREDRKSILIATLKKFETQTINHVDDVWIETSRLFVVPDQWPTSD